MDEINDCVWATYCCAYRGFADFIQVNSPQIPMNRGAPILLHNSTIIACPAGQIPFGFLSQGIIEPISPQIHGDMIIRQEAIYSIYASAFESELLIDTTYPYVRIISFLNNVEYAMYGLEEVDVNWELNDTVFISKNNLFTNKGNPGDIVIAKVIAPNILNAGKKSATIFFASPARSDQNKRR